MYILGEQCFLPFISSCCKLWSHGVWTREKDVCVCEWVWKNKMCKCLEWARAMYPSLSPYFPLLMRWDIDAISTCAHNLYHAHPSYALSVCCTHVVSPWPLTVSLCSARGLLRTLCCLCDSVWFHALPGPLHAGARGAGALHSGSTPAAVLLTVDVPASLEIWNLLVDLFLWLVTLVRPTHVELATSQLKISVLFLW